MIDLKFHTHDRTSKSKNSKTVIFLLVLCTILFYGIFGMVAFACFHYADNIFASILLMAIPLFLTAIMRIAIRDMEKVYIEIKENEICVADYYFGIKREKHFLISDVTSKEIYFGNSWKVKGYHVSSFAQYFVFYHNKKYLFKMICFPETEALLKQYGVFC